MEVDDFKNLNIETLEAKLDEVIQGCWPNRPGNADPNLIFQNIGHALTRWERVEVSLFETLLAMQTKLEDGNKIKRNFGKKRSALERIDLMVSQFNKHSIEQTHLVAFEDQYRLILEQYLIWKTARNRLAHGVVIATAPMMMDDILNGNIQTYQLHPSESFVQAWLFPWDYIQTPIGEVAREGNSDDLYIADGPSYNYMAEDVVEISNKFLNLDHELRRFTRLFIGKKDGFENLIYSDEEDDLSI